MSLLPHDWFYYHDSGVEWAMLGLVRELVNHISLGWRQILSHHAVQGEKLDATEVAGSHVHLIPEEPCAAMTFTNERNISLFAPPPHNHRTMISSFERRAEVSVYWPLNPAIICQAQQYRVQMTVVLTLKECNHSFCKSTSISRNL